MSCSYLQLSFTDAVKPDYNINTDLLASEVDNTEGTQKPPAKDNTDGTQKPTDSISTNLTNGSISTNITKRSISTNITTGSKPTDVPTMATSTLQNTKDDWRTFTINSSGIYVVKIYAKNLDVTEKKNAFLYKLSCEYTCVHV